MTARLPARHSASAATPQASAAWAAFTDVEKAHWNAKAADKNTEKGAARAAMAATAAAPSDSDEESVAPMDNNNHSDSEEDLEAADEAAETQIVMANYDSDSDSA